jgi:hypothetical protein
LIGEIAMVVQSLAPAPPPAPKKKQLPGAFVSALTGLPVSELNRLADMTDQERAEAEC